MLLLFIGILALTYLVAAIWWIAEEAKSHSKENTERHLKILSIVSERDRAVIEQNFSTKGRHSPFACATIVTFYIMMFSIFGLFYSIFWLFGQLRKCLNHHTKVA